MFLAQVCSTSAFVTLLLLFLFIQSIGSGILDVRRMLNFGINVCLGTGRILLQQY